MMISLILLFCSLILSLLSSWQSQFLEQTHKPFSHLFRDAGPETQLQQVGIVSNPHAGWRGGLLAPVRTRGVVGSGPNEDEVALVVDFGLAGK